MGRHQGTLTRMAVPRLPPSIRPLNAELQSISLQVRVVFRSARYKPGSKFVLPSSNAVMRPERTVRRCKIERTGRSRCSKGTFSN